MSTDSTAALAGTHNRVHFGLRPAQSARSSGRVESAVVWLLTAFVFVLPADLRLAGGKSIAMRLGFACLVVGIFGIIRRRSAVVPSLGFWVLLGFVLWSTCTLAWAEFPAAAQHKVIQYWVLFAELAVIPQYAWNLRTRTRLVDAYLAGCWLGVIGVSVNFVAGIPYASPDGVLDMEGRYSFGTDPNYLALALVIGIPMALHRARTLHARWQKLLFLLYVPASLTGIIFTGSRGALLAVAAAVVVYGIVTSWKTRLLLAVGAVLCISAAWLLPWELSERFASIPDELRHGTLSDRRELWDRGAAVAKEHPIEGVGAGATTGKFEIAAHNTPLELMMEGGAMSLAFFYGAFLLATRKAWESDPREGQALLGVGAAWFVGSLSLSWEVNTITWFLLAMLFSAGATRSNPSESVSRQGVLGELEEAR